MLGQLPLYAVGSAFTPASLALTAFYRDYTNPNWPGTASVGTSGSGSNDLNDPGTEPAQGTALNGWGVADFNGSDDFLTADGTLNTYVATTAFSGWALIRPELNAGGEHIWGHNTFVGTVIRLGLDGASGARLQVNNAAASVTRAITLSVYSLVTFRYDGTNLQIGVNEVPGAAGGASTAAYSTALTSLAGSVSMGAISGPAAPFDGQVADFGVTNTVLNDATFNSIKSYVNQRYALSI